MPEQEKPPARLVDSYYEKMINIEIKLSDVKIRISLHLEETKRYFKDYITQEECDSWDIRVEEEDIIRYPLICPTGILDPFSEAYLLIPKASAFLLKYGCVLIHGVSFVWRGYSWLFTAPSGTGKTTQLHHWLNLYGKEIDLINGDKSVLSVKDNKTIWLYPCPWMGKEKEVGNAFAPIGGIIVLRQSRENSIRRMIPRESVLEIYQQFLNTGDTAEEIHALERICNLLLNNVPIWLLSNLGDEDSTKLTYQTLLEYEELIR